MEKEAIKSLLETIDQQVNAAILGGTEESYEELERLGYVTIDKHRVQHFATLTPEGLHYLEMLHNQE